ncbi:MAG: M48 family metallopeptidase [Gammaproteobacteria bacterium]|nr:M48 family metallopeptidase [Gammaproteobacteria bacterium]
MNLFTGIFIFALALSVLVQWFLIHRHIRHVAANRDSVPDDFSHSITLNDHRKAADYTCDKSRLGLYELLFSSIVILVWTLGGGLQLLDTAVRSAGLETIWTGTLFILCFLAVSAVLDLPLGLYRTFSLEQKYGFNKMTVKMFIMDMVKTGMLVLLIGTPLILLVLWIMQSAGSFWWIYVWLTWLVFSIFMMWAYPAFIAPLFNKFRPLENEELRQRIDSLLTRNGFANQGIFVMDGSARSTHGNAYFTGLGKNKRIVFFDTLLDELKHDEIEAVLAHELGHFKCNHIVKRICILGTVFLAGLALLGWFIQSDWFFTGLGVENASTYMALVLFVVISPAFTFLLQPLFSWISRQHEFEADDFAASQAHSVNLVHALVKLYKENANTLTPDPLYSAFHDSHPPAPIRIAHLNTNPA